MSLSPVAADRHVDEAIRLFNVSTLHAVQSGPGQETLSPEYVKKISACQSFVLKKLHRGSQMSHSKLKRGVMSEVWTELLTINIQGI